MAELHSEFLIECVVGGCSVNKSGPTLGDPVDFACRLPCPSLSVFCVTVQEFAFSASSQMPLQTLEPDCERCCCNGNLILFCLQVQESSLTRRPHPENLLPTYTLPEEHLQDAAADNRSSFSCLQQKITKCLHMIGAGVWMTSGISPTTEL